MTKNLNISNASVLTKIRYRNEFVETLIKMDIDARAVLFLAIAQIDSKSCLKYGISYEIKATDYVKLVGVEQSYSYKVLKKAALKLQKQLIEIPLEKMLDPIKIPGTDSLKDSISKDWGQKKLATAVSISVLECCAYIPTEGHIHLQFSRYFIPYISSLRKSYTAQSLVASLKITDYQSNNLYQLICYNLSKNNYMFFIIEISELKRHLGMIKTNENDEEVLCYADFKEFKKRMKICFKKITDINEYSFISSISMSVEERLNRKAHSVRISYNYKKRDYLDI